MPNRTSKDINNEPCKVCGTVIRYKADMPRHNRLHFANKEAMMYKCPFVNCQYQNLQKSNLSTHMTTHTGQKPHTCPDCEFSTGDPGSLTRHRKRIHAYVPNGTSKARSTPTKRSRHYAPYKRQSTSPASSRSSSQSLPEESSDIVSVLPLASAPYSSAEAPDVSLDGLYSYPLEKGLFQSRQSSSQACPTRNSEFFMTPQPRALSPAFDTCSQLRTDDGSFYCYANEISVLFPQLSSPAVQLQQTALDFMDYINMPWLFDTPSAVPVLDTFPTSLDNTNTTHFSYNKFMFGDSSHQSPELFFPSSLSPSLSNFSYPPDSRASSPYPPSPISPSSSFSSSPISSFFNDLPSSGLFFQQEDLGLIFPTLI